MQLKDNMHAKSVDAFSVFIHYFLPTMLDGRLHEDQKVSCLFNVYISSNSLNNRQPISAMAILAVDSVASHHTGCRLCDVY